MEVWRRLAYLTICIVCLLPALFQESEGFWVSNIFQQNGRCSTRQKRPCGFLLSQTACQLLGCCYEMSLFYGPLCYRAAQESDTTTPRNIQARRFQQTNVTPQPPPTTRTTTRASLREILFRPQFLPVQPVQPSTEQQVLTALLNHLANQGGKREQQLITSPSRATVPPFQRQETTTRSTRVFTVSTTTTAKPVTRDIREAFTSAFTQAQQTLSSTTSITTRNTDFICDNDANRRDCGFPGITPQQCLERNCCWDSNEITRYWCFQRTIFIEEAENPAPPPTVVDGNPVLRNEIENEREELVDPDDETESLFPPKSESESNTNDEERLFLALVQSELMELEPNVINSKANPSTTMTASTLQSTTSRQESHSAVVGRRNLNLAGQQTSTDQEETPEWLRELLEANETTSVGPESISLSTSTGQSKEEILLPYPDRNASSINNNTSAVTPSGEESSLVPITDLPPATTTANSLEVALFLKLLDDLEKQRRLTNLLGNTCVLDDQDFCCRSDPTAPCCEFQIVRELYHRASPMTRIVGGGPAGYLRYSVAYLAKGHPVASQFCGGTLLDANWVLTAAHCVLEYCHGLRPKQELKISLGKYHKSPFHYDPGQQDFGVNDVICHPSHCKSRGQPRLNDLALIRLSRSAQITPFVAPATMPSAFELPMDDKNCIVMGWGSTQGSGSDNVLKEVSVPMISNKQCNQPNWRNCVVRACMMCAGDIKIDPCDGDSGGPLFCRRPNGLFALHGVYSWGRCGREVRKPAVYTRASYFVEWINRITQTYTGTV